jgi:hypothetical protein
MLFVWVKNFFTYLFVTPEGRARRARGEARGEAIEYFLDSLTQQARDEQRQLELQRDVDDALAQIRRGEARRRGELV